VGRVTSAEAFYHDVDVVVAPVFGGGGIKIKVLDAAGRGLPVVATSTAVEGLGSPLPAGLVVNDDPESFALLVCTFLSQPGRLPIDANVAWYRRLVRLGEVALAWAVAPRGLLEKETQR